MRTPDFCTLYVKGVESGESEYYQVGFSASGLNLVWFLSLPLYHCMAFRQRAFRARKVSAILAAAADTGHLWTARRPRPSGSRLARAHLSFGCDVKATSAHLDVFDLSRSLVDWAPSRWVWWCFFYRRGGHGAWVLVFHKFS